MKFLVIVLVVALVALKTVSSASTPNILDNVKHTLTGFVDGLRERFNNLAKDFQETVSNAKEVIEYQQQSLSIKAKELNDNILKQILSKALEQVVQWTQDGKDAFDNITAVSREWLEDAKELIQKTVKDVSQQVNQDVDDAKTRIQEALESNVANAIECAVKYQKEFQNLTESSIESAKSCAFNAQESTASIVADVRDTFGEIPKAVNIIFKHLQECVREVGAAAPDVDEALKAAGCLVDVVKTTTRVVQDFIDKASETKNNAPERIAVAINELRTCALDTVQKSQQKTQSLIAEFFSCLKGQ